MDEAYLVENGIFEVQLGAEQNMDGVDSCVNQECADQDQVILYLSLVFLIIMVDTDNKSIYKVHLVCVWFHIREFIPSSKLILDKFLRV